MKLNMFISSICLLFAFPIIFIEIAYEIAPCVKGGDLATWFSGYVTLMAVVAAIIAAIWAKNASDIANENSTFLFLRNLVEKEFSKFDEEFKSIEKAAMAFHQALAAQSDMRNFQFTHVIGMFWGCAIVSSRKMSEIFSEVMEDISHTKISNQSKEQLILKFLYKIDSQAVQEMIVHCLSVPVFEYKPKGFIGDKEIYRNYSKITDAMKSRGMYEDWFKIAESFKDAEDFKLS